MYKLLIVDDEEIEREGLAQYIPWEKYDIQVIGTAWNGQDGLEQIAQERPDLVLVDINMPVMDGLEMIRRCRDSYPDVMCVILSGHGDYEFTSQAMQEGIRFYVLKPCDEQQIVAVLEQAKAVLEKHRKDAAREQAQHRQLGQMLHRAKSQYFRNLLLGREPWGVSDLIPQGKYAILTLRKEEPFQQSQQELVQRSFCEVYGPETVLTTTAIDNDLCLLLTQSSNQEIERLLRYFREEWAAQGLSYQQAAMTRSYCPGEFCEGWQQIRKLFRMGKGMKQTLLLQKELFRQIGGADHLVNIRQLGSTAELGELLYQVRCALAKMELKGMPLPEKLEVCHWTIKVLYGTEAALEKVETEESLCHWFAQELCRHNPALQEQTRDGDRMQALYYGIYDHFDQVELSLRKLSRDVLFLNEDYVGRLFQKHTGMKVSDYLQKQRIRMAQELMSFRPDARIGQIVTLVGFAPDGQYFSRTFRKLVGKSPRSYQAELADKNSGQ